MSGRVSWSLSESSSDEDEAVDGIEDHVTALKSSNDGDVMANGERLSSEAAIAGAVDGSFVSFSFPCPLPSSCGSGTSVLSFPSVGRFGVDREEKPADGRLGLPGMLVVSETRRVNENIDESQT